MDLPDVVFLTVDTLRADHVSFINPESPSRTPHMDSLAADGVVYTQALASISVTGPSFVTLMTGQTPASHGRLQNTQYGIDELPGEVDTLAERLQAAGYDTAAFLSGYTLRRSLGLDQGFAVYNAPSARDGSRRPGDETAALTTDWLRRSLDDRPDLVWFHSYDAHGPLTPYTQRAPEGGEWKRGGRDLSHVPPYQRIGSIVDPEFYALRYAEAVEFADLQVGEVLDALRRQGRYDDALIVLTADHGETLTEREVWFDHGTHASIEQLHVPLVVKLPANARAGTREDQLVGLVDVAPSVLDWLKLPSLAHADGQLLVQGHDALLGESSHCKSAPVLRCRPRGRRGKEFALRSEAQTVVRRSRLREPSFLAYDRATDPGEERPLRLDDTHAAFRSRLVAEVARRSRAGMDLDGPEGDADSLEAQMLEMLGYTE